ncbi:MAG: hydrolase [Bacteroidetes bacterium]|nr:MAG: hydrolase [Bacteroidota bacterium]
MLHRSTLPIFLFLFIVCAQSAFSQGNPETPKRQLVVRRAQESPRIDGMPEDAVWSQAVAVDSFFNKWPTDVGFSATRTEVKAASDDNFLYFFATCYDEGKRVVQSLRRDQDLETNDAFAIVLDPVNRKTNGFFFSVNSMGAQTEALISVSDEGYNSAWDNKWFSSVKQYPDRYEIEIAIPFKTLRYEEGLDEWGINFIRSDMKTNNFSVWSYIPLQFNGIDMGYTGKLLWESSPKKGKGNVSLIPYVTGGMSQDIEAGEEMKQRFNAGLDAKVAITPSLNLDLTFNPDFSQIEVDRQVTNLTRFSIFFPERRTFFLENGDIFGSFGIPPITPFFSRTIGLREGRPVPIYLGARLSGNLTEQARVGLMTLQTGAQDSIPGSNYTVGAVRVQVLKRSSVTGIVINRQGFDGANPIAGDFARNAGMEFNYLSADSKWSGWAQFHNSFNPEKFKDTYYWCFGGAYASRNLSIVVAPSYSGSNYLTEMGFNARLENYDAARDTVVRLGYYILYQSADLSFYPKKIKGINQHGPRVELFPVMNTDGSLNELNLSNQYSINFSNQSELSLSHSYTEVNLPFATNLIDGPVPLPSAHYDFHNVGIEYNSNARKRLSLQSQISTGGFYNGKISSIVAGLNYRAQPWGNFGINFERNVVRLPDPYGSAELYLISPRIELSFTRNLFWTTFLQYNTQADNFNINSRLQWRFKPMSDLFVVYTDNYALQEFGVRNRAIVLKLNYWLTL